MRLGEAEAREADDLVVDALGDLALDTAADRALDEPLLIAAHRGLGSLAAHRPAQPLGLADREARERDRHLEHLVLEDDRAERVAQRRLQRGVLVGHLVCGIRAQPLAPLDVGVDGAALDRPRAHQRHLHGEVVEVRRQRPRQHLHLGPALDLEDAGRLGALDRAPDLGVVERDPREVDALAARARDLVDAALDRREHPQPEQVDLEEAGVGAGVLVPLHDLAALHRRRLHRAELDQRLGRDHHAARGAGRCGAAAPRSRAAAAASARQRGERARRSPERLLDPRLCVGARLVDVDGAGEALDLARRQPQRLAEVAHRAARAVGGEGGDQRRALGAVALVHPRDQLLADVAREVEVDVGRVGQLLVQEAPEEEVVADRVDVREAGQVADDRADARAAPAPGGQQPAAPSRARAPRARPRAASSSMSWWSRKKPDEPSFRISPSSSSSRAASRARRGRRRAGAR